MHHDLKHFYELVIDYHRVDALPYEYKTTLSYRNMLDTHPNCEDEINAFAELAVELYNHSDGPAGQALAQELNKIEKHLDSCRLPF